MNLDRTLALAGRIVAQVRRDPRTLALIVLVPVFVLALLGYLIGLQDGSGTAFALYAPAPDSPGYSAGPGAMATLGDRVAAALAEPVPGGAISFKRYASEEAALEAVRSGEADACLVLPADFGASLLAGRAIRARLVLEGSDPALRSVVPQAATAALASATARALAELAGPAFAPPSTDGVSVEYLHGGPSLDRLDAMAPALVAFFVFFLVFLLTCVAFMRERTGGTLERLRASPLTRLEISVGYMIGFGFFALVQSAVAIGFAVWVLGANAAGPLGWAFATSFLLAIGAVNLGVFFSTFAQNELQAVQFIPIVIVPQGLLCGLLFPLESMPRWLRAVADLLPMTVGVRTMEDIMVRGYGFGEIVWSLGWLVLVALGAAALSALSIGRRAS